MDRPGPYTLKHLSREAAHHLPAVALNLPMLLRSFVSEERIAGPTRLAVQLRYARLMGCPVCANLFPPLGPRLGLSRSAVRSALEGQPEGLTEEQYGAVVYAGELVANDGEPPLELPEAARMLPPRLLRQLEASTRLELVVHATGLMVLPDGLITRTCQGT